MLDAVSEVGLVAPREITALANEAERFFMRYINETNNTIGPGLASSPEALGSALPIEALAAIDQMAVLMRRDLGTADD